MQTNTQPNGNKYLSRALHPSPLKTPQCFPFRSKIILHTQRKKKKKKKEKKKKKTKKNNKKNKKQTKNKQTKKKKKKKKEEEEKDNGCCRKSADVDWYVRVGRKSMAEIILLCARTLHHCKTPRQPPPAEEMTLIYFVSTLMSSNKH